MATSPKPTKPIRSVVISPNVTIKAPKGKPGFTPAEVKRLMSITEILKPVSKATAKVNAKALKASGKVKPKTDTQYKRFKDNSFNTEKLTARELAREAAAKRAAARGGMPGGAMGGGGLGIGRTR
jgi:hypothetical protein